jgi:transposase
LTWAEYRAGCPDGFGYTWFTQHYRAWAGRLDVVLRGDHRAGEKLFLDFAGQTIPITDPLTGEIWQAQLFVAVLGASNYTYAEATVSQAELCWTAAHVNTFEYMGGAPAVLVPDNLKAGVTRPHRYEPDLNAAYAELAAHYGCAIIPARPYKPRDKAKVEQGVLVAERWIAAALRNRTFFSLAEANRAIRERVAWLNARPFKKLEGSRDSLFAELDRPALRAALVAAVLMSVALLFGALPVASPISMAAMAGSIVLSFFSSAQNDVRLPPPPPGGAPPAGAPPAGAPPAGALLDDAPPHAASARVYPATSTPRLRAEGNAARSPRGGGAAPCNNKNNDDAGDDA